MGTGVLEVVIFVGVDMIVKGGVLEVVFAMLSPLRPRMPPTAPVLGARGLVEFVAFLAKSANASRVFPVSGALMTPTSPVWQW